MFVLMRRACLMEDEGREEHIGTFSTKAEVESAIEKYTKDGYFRRSDLYVCETQSK